MQTRGSSRAGQLQCGLRRRGAGSSRRAGRSRQAQAGGVPRIVLAEGKKINLAWCPVALEKKRKKGQVRSWGGASRSDPRSAADPQGVGRTGLSSAHLVLHPPSPRSYGPSIHLRSGSFAAGGEPVKGLWHPSHYEARRASPSGGGCTVTRLPLPGRRPRHCVAAIEEVVERPESAYTRSHVAKLRQG